MTVSAWYRFSALRKSDDSTRFSGLLALAGLGAAALGGAGARARHSTCERLATGGPSIRTVQGHGPNQHPSLRRRPCLIRPGTSTVASCCQRMHPRRTRPRALSSKPAHPRGAPTGRCGSRVEALNGDGSTSTRRARWLKAAACGQVPARGLHRPAFASLRAVPRSSQVPALTTRSTHSTRSVPRARRQCIGWVRRSRMISDRVRHAATLTDPCVRPYPSRSICRRISRYSTADNSSPR
jgi:hypothetical protein